MRLLEITLVMVISSMCCFAQTSLECHRSLQVSNGQPLQLHVEIDRADLQILYDRDGELSIHGTARAAGDAKLDEDFFASRLSAQQNGNEITVRYLLGAAHLADSPKVQLRIGVPFRTEVQTSVQAGTQTVRGLLGPIDVHSHKGDIRASYISRQVHAEVESGNLDLEVIGEPVIAKVGVGNISGQRLEKGIQAETNDGDITLMVVGSSSATVTAGSGRIEVGGARGALTLSTDAGDLRVEAAPHSEWKLHSRLGTIRLSLPQKLNAQLEAASDSEELQIERDDISKDQQNPNSVTVQIGSGGKLIAAHTGKGKIVIQ